MNNSNLNDKPREYLLKYINYLENTLEQKSKIIELLKEALSDKIVEDILNRETNPKLN